MELNLELFVKIAYALGVGVLIGLERSMVGKPESDGDEASEQDALLGVRTYSILSLGGFAAALVGREGGANLAAAALMAGLIALVVAMYLRSSQQDLGITTESSAVASCGLGFLCLYHPQAAGVLALLVTALLASKRFMNLTLKRLRRIELTDTLKFLAIILIVWPLLPNRALDPYNAFNPHKVMFLVILISGISFVGYFLTKFLGAERGLGLTGLLGGLTSSTAVTAAMAQQAKQSPSLSNPCTFATIIANATMFGRVLVVVAIIDWALVPHLAWSIGTMCAAAALATAVLWLRSRRATRENPEQTSKELSLSNPFSLGPALKFAAFFVGILFVARMAKLYLGDQGLYLASLVSGLADVDPITLSIAESTKAAALTPSVGAIGITIAVVANSVVKSGIAFYSGGLKYGLKVGAILMGATLAGLAVLFAV